MILETNTYKVCDFSSVLLQQMHNHLATPLTIMEYKKSLVKLHSKKNSSYRQILSDKSTNDFNSKHHYGTSTRLAKRNCLRHVKRSRKHGTGTKASPNRRKSNAIIYKRNLQHKATKKADENSQIYIKPACS